MLVVAEKGRPLAQTAEAQARRRATRQRNVAAERAWRVSDQPAWLNEHVYRERIQPSLSRFSAVKLASALGISIPYAVHVRAGKRRPHPRHWLTLARLAARVALISGDQLLRDAASARVITSGNIHILESIDALKGLINTLGSSVDEQFIAAIKDRAAEAFYKTKDETTLYYKASVGASLSDTLAKASFKLPDGADKYNVEKWTINPPRFVKKQGQRIYWTTRFEARIKALKSATPPQWQTAPFILSSTSGDAPKPQAWTTGLNLGSLMNLTSSGVVSPATAAWSSTSPILVSGIDDQFIAFGAASVDVSWSVAVTTSGVLTKLQLESVEFVEVIWG